MYSPEKMTVGQLLSLTNPPIIVPDWQRNYSWTDSHVETFWSDLLQFHARYPTDAAIRNQEYFLGSVVIVVGGENHLLLDGQQRIATAAILLSVIREFLKRFSADAASRLHSKYLSDFDDTRNQTTYKLTLNTYDRDFFQREVLESRNAGFVQPVPAIESHRLIRRARQIFATEFEDEFARQLTPEAAHRWALRIGTVLKDHMSVVAVTSNDEDNAADVFETLNDRGIGLSTLDLLRNFILRRAVDGERAELIALWGDILQLEGDDRVRVFLRHYWISLYGDVKTQTLYREIKTRLDAEGVSSLVFTRGLRDAAENYEDIVAGRHDDADIAGYFKDVGTLNATALYPAMLAAYAVGNEDRLRHFLRTLIAVYVRHHVIGRRNTSSLETAVFEVARQLRLSRDFDAAIGALQGFAPNDAAFVASFKTATVSRRSSAAYVLRQLEAARRVTEELDVAPPSKVHVDHIYPQTPQAGHALADHDALIDRIGNLTLLGRKLNSAARNETFQNKKAFYQQSVLLISQELNAQDAWTSAEITERQERFAEAAPGIWPVAPAAPPAPAPPANGA